jgi:hypothetical protein
MKDCPNEAKINFLCIFSQFSIFRYFIVHAKFNNTIPIMFNWSDHSCKCVLRVRMPFRREVIGTTLCDNVCQWLAAGRRFSQGTRVFSTNKTDRHDITDILLKLALKYPPVFHFHTFTQHSRIPKQTVTGKVHVICRIRNTCSVVRALISVTHVHWKEKKSCTVCPSI